MAAKSAEKIDSKTLQKAVAWSLHYLLDPKRGKGTNLPSDKELEEKFPESNVTRALIEFELKNLFGVDSIEKIPENEGKVREVTEKTGADGTIEESAAPAILPKIPSGKRVSALGVLAELEIIEPLLEKHKQETQSRLAQSLNSKIRQILPSLGLKSANEEQFLKIVNDVAQETAHQSLEDVSKIESIEQVSTVIADSLTQSIVTHPELTGSLKTSEEEIFNKVAGQAQDIANIHKEDLEKAAVLGSLAAIAKLKRPNEQLKEIVAESARATTETEAPLSAPETEERIKGSMNSYLASYAEELNNELAKLPKGEIPTLAQLQKAKENAHLKATAKIGTALSQSKEGKALDSKIGFRKITSSIAGNLGLIIPKSATPQKNLPIAAPLILNSQSHINEAHLSLLSLDQDRLAKELSRLNELISRLKKQNSLSYQDRKDLYGANKKYALYVKAQAFHVKSSKKADTYRTLFAQALGGRTEFASHEVWRIQQSYGFYTPRTYANNQNLISGIVLRRMSSTLGLNLGINFSLPKLPSVGMGKAVTSRLFIAATAASLSYGVIKRVAKIGSAILGGLGLYFLHLAKGALIGFLAGTFIGGGIGAIGGAIIGAQIGAAIGTLIFPGVGTAIGALAGGAIGATVGFFAGATIGGIIGGTIGYGLSSGSTTTAATGIGAAVGFGVGGPIGMFVGAGVGFLIGKFAIPFAQGAFNTVSGGAAAGAGATAGILGTAASFVTGLASTAWGGVASIGGGAFGLLSGAANLVVGGLTSITIPASAAFVPVAAGVTAVSVTGIVVGVVTATTFFSVASEDDTSQTVPGQNQFFTITKNSDQSHLDNPPPDKEVTFTVSLTAKDLNLNNISITDEINVTTQTTTFNIATDKEGNPISPGACPQQIPAGGNCTFSYTITVNDTFKDSTISNLATVKATPEGQPEVTESVTATVVVGNPPAECPRGWPAIGDVTQGPEGATSHGPGGYEAFDIGQGAIGGVGKPVYATVEGTVVESFINNGDNLDQRIGVAPTACTGLEIVYYWHLSARRVNVGNIVTFGQEIGATGQAGTGPHIHYQFNRSFNRNFEIAPPYVPKSVPRACDSPADCNVHISSAP